MQFLGDFGPNPLDFAGRSPYEGRRFLCMEGTNVYLSKESAMAKSKALTKSQVQTALAEAVGVPKKQAAQFLDALAALAYKQAKVGFTLPGLGKLVLVQRKARWGRNPATGERIHIKAKKVLKFRIAKAAKDAVL